MPETFEKFKDLKYGRRQKYVLLLYVKNIAWSIDFIISVQYDVVISQRQKRLENL